MRIRHTPHLGLCLVEPEVFRDFRGTYTETYNKSMVPFFKLDFVQDDAIQSKMNVLRGYHGDYETWKYITCLWGEFLISAVNIDPMSPTYLKEDTIKLSSTDKMGLLLPPKHVNAHQCTSRECVFFYKQTTFYHGEEFQYSIHYDEFGVDWPNIPVCSERDILRARSYTDYIRNGRLIRPEDVNV